jgi:hypothetical protein
MDGNEHANLLNFTHPDTKPKQRSSIFIAVLHFTVTVGFSIMNITHTLK